MHFIIRNSPTASWIVSGLLVYASVKVSGLSPQIQIAGAPSGSYEIVSLIDWTADTAGLNIAGYFEGTA